MKTVEFIQNKSIGMEAYNCGCNFVGDKYCQINHSGTYVLLTEAEAEIAALRERQLVLVEILRRTWSLLCEIGSPNCNMELARKDVNMMAEEIRAALAAKEG